MNIVAVLRFIKARDCQGAYYIPVRGLSIEAYFAIEEYVDRAMIKCIMALDCVVMNESVVFTRMKDTSLVPCERCGAVVPGGSGGCQALFADLLALEYRNSAYGAVNLLAVDAHALQHPEDHGVKNNPFHLLWLCWLLEYGGDPRIGQGPIWLQNQFDGNPEIGVL